MHFPNRSSWLAKLLVVAVIAPLCVLSSAAAAAAQSQIYYVDTLTEGFNNSGTNDPVWIYIVGEHGSLAAELDNPGDDMRIGQWDYFKLESDKDIGRVAGVRIVLHHGDNPSIWASRITDDWEFALIKIYGPSDSRFPEWTKASPGHEDAGSAKYDLYTLESDGRVAPGRQSMTQNVGVDRQARDDWFKVMDYPLRGSQELVTSRLPLGYFVNVLTSDRDYAGTDDDVYITLIGETGQSVRRRLDNPDSDDLERGQWNYYKFSTSQDLGRITHVELELDGDDGWRPQIVYVLGPSDPLFPDWRKQGAGPRDEGRIHDFYRFNPEQTELDEGGLTSLTIELDERGQQDLANVSPDHLKDWSENSTKWLYIESFKALSPSAGIGDAVRVMGQIGGFLAQAGIESVPYAGEIIGPVIVEVVQGVANEDDWGGVGQGLIEAIDGRTAGADDFYFKIDGQDITTGDGDELHYSLDENEERVVNHTVHLRKLVRLELMEYDLISNDSLGGLIFNPNMQVTTSVGGENAIVASTEQRSIYKVNYYILRCQNSNPTIVVRNGRASCN